MTLEEAKQKVQEIDDISNDDESAHSNEDSLYIQFVMDIAEGKDREQWQEVAKEILKTLNINFARWCA